MRITTTASLLALLLVTPLAASAETVLRAGGDISLEAEQVVEGDYYVMAGPFGRTSMTGAVEGDMYAVGGSVVSNGSVAEDAAIVAGTAQVHGPVEDDVRIIAGDVTISEAVGGDVFVIAGTLEILSSASIAGSVFFFGGDATIAGAVEGSVQGRAERVRIDAPVGGDVQLRAPAGITLGDNAAIVGSLQYESVVSLVRSQSSVVEGEVSEQMSAPVDERDQWRALLTPIFIVLFAALSLFLVFKRELTHVAATLQRTYLRSALVGAAVFLAGPLIAVLLMVTALGLFLGLAVAGLLIAAYALSFALAGVMFGVIVAKQLFNSAQTVTLTTVLLGTLGLQLLLFVPILGPVLYAVMFMLTLGAICRFSLQAFSK